MEFADKSFFLPKPGGNPKDYENFNEGLKKLRESLEEQFKRLEESNKQDKNKEN